MLAQLIVNCHREEIARVSMFMTDTGLAQNCEHWHQDPCQVRGDYIEFTGDLFKALEALCKSPRVGNCELHF